MTRPLPVNYTGPSMNPTLKAGDVLTTIPYEDRKIRVGDIVVFQPSEGMRHVVHRVVSYDSCGVKTRGDNNPKADPYVMPPSRIIGKVDSVKRGNINIPICGGHRGSIYANILLITKRINVILSKILHPAYHWLSQKGFLRRILSPLLKTKVLYFKKHGSVEMQILIGRRVVARRLPGDSEWRIRRPYRLVIDETFLMDKHPVP
jgi:signal peptidase I